MWYLGTSYVSTEQHLHAIESTTTEGAPVAEGLPEKANAIGDTRENDRDRNTLTTGNSLRVHSLSGKNFPAIFGCQPIKLELYPLMHAYPANYLRVHLGISGYIKRVK